MISRGVLLLGLAASASGVACSSSSSSPGLSFVPLNPGDAGVDAGCTVMTSGTHIGCAEAFRISGLPTASSVAPRRNTEWDPTVLDFAALLDPVRSEDFLASHWERKPLVHRRGDARYYDALLSSDDLERFNHSQPFSPAGYSLPSPLFEVDLEPGDLLYLPRGTVHCAFTSDRHSAHVTIGLTVFTWVDLMSELLQPSKLVPAFREALPAGFASRDDLRATLKHGLAHRLRTLIEHVDHDALIDSFARRVRSGRPRPARALQSSVRVIDRRSELAPPEKHRYRIATENGNTTLELDGRKLLLPAGVRSTLDAICARSSFRPADLPSDLDEPTTLAFVRFLEDEGFLTQVG